MYDRHQEAPPRTAEVDGSAGALVLAGSSSHVHRPRLDYESHATGLDRNELGALLVAAGLGPPAEDALISLLALNGLRVSGEVHAGDRVRG